MERGSTNYSENEKCLGSTQVHHLSSLLVCILRKHCLCSISCTNHSVDCERSFSVLCMVKTKLQSCLTNKSLNSLLVINLEGPELNDSDFRSTMQKWPSILKAMCIYRKTMIC